jgi:hypothetical protein
MSDLDQNPNRIRKAFWFRFRQGKKFLFLRFRFGLHNTGVKQVICCSIDNVKYFCTFSWSFEEL